MKVIYIESTAFYALIEQVVLHVRKEHGETVDKWVDHAEAMRLLNIKSKATLQKFRDEGKIRFSQPSKKIILYDRESYGSVLGETRKKHALAISNEYTKGFNEGYVMTAHLPDLAHSISEVESAAPRMEGFRDGREQYVLDRARAMYPSWLKNDRNAEAPSDPARPVEETVQEKEGAAAPGRELDQGAESSRRADREPPVGQEPQ